MAGKVAFLLFRLLERVDDSVGEAAGIVLLERVPETISK